MSEEVRMFIVQFLYLFRLFFRWSCNIQLLFSDRSWFLIRRSAAV